MKRTLSEEDARAIEQLEEEVVQGHAPLQLLDLPDEMLLEVARRAFPGGALSLRTTSPGLQTIVFNMLSRRFHRAVDRAVERMQMWPPSIWVQEPGCFTSRLHALLTALPALNLSQFFIATQTDYFPGYWPPLVRLHEQGAPDEEIRTLVRAWQAVAPMHAALWCLYLARVSGRQELYFALVLEEETPTRVSVSSWKGTYLEPLTRVGRVLEVTPIQYTPERAYNWFTVRFEVAGRDACALTREVSLRVVQSGADDADEAGLFEHADAVIDLGSGQTNTHPEITKALRAIEWHNTTRLGEIFAAGTGARVRNRKLRFLQGTFQQLATLLSGLVSVEQPGDLVLLCDAGIERSLVLFNMLYIALDLLASGREHPRVVWELRVRRWSLLLGRERSIANPIIPNVIEQLPGTMLALL